MTAANNSSIENYLPEPSRYGLTVMSGERAESMTFADLLPRGACPYFAHTLIPYMLTLRGGGRFPWMEKIAPDAVDAQCPNPSGAVTGRLREAEGGFVVTIRSVRGNCPIEYKRDDSMEWRPAEKPPLEDLNLLLSWMLQLHSTGGPESPLITSASNPEVNYRIEGEESAEATPCPPEAAFTLRLGHFTHRCRYHKLPRREEYDRSDWIPGGLCPELFHAAYPSCLSLIYSDKPGISRPLNCPAGGRVNVLAATEDRLDAPLRKAVMKIFRPAGKSVEIPFRRCRIHVMRAADCPLGMERGTDFEFNMGGLRGVCPAFFHNSYPVLAALMRSGKPPWQGLENNRGLVQCPDSSSNITMIYEPE